MADSKRESTAGRCVFCDHEIDPRSDYRKVSGWERVRSGGGTNALRVRKLAEEWACRWCVDRLAKGIDPGQASLL